MEAIFWIIAFIIIYHYFLFPFFVFFLAFLAERPIKKGSIQPTVSLVIAAYNEENVIEHKINNCFDLDYPIEKLEIIIVSDGSNDSTPQIVDKYKTDGVISIYSPLREGKTAALNKGVAKGQGEIVVFSDANSIFEPDAIRLLVRNFFDPSVGGVCGRKSILKNFGRESSLGDSLYWDLESKIKIMQSRMGSITTGDGEIFAIRRALYQEMHEEIINDDTAITLNIVLKGYRVIYEPEAISNEEASIVIEDDFKVKARMVAGGYQTLAIYGSTLFSQFNLFGFLFFSHKILRWVMPILLILLYVSNLLILEGIFVLFFIAQSLFYVAGIIGYCLRKINKSPRLFYFPLYYCSMNTAALVGLFYFFSRKSGTKIWKKAER